ncbi:MAG: isocitrate/isopropylmalate dehydrogenase family protein [Phycisphaerales bacterium JB043]
MTTHTVVLLPGDGIGPEVTEATTRILDASGASLTYISKQVGVGAIESGSETVLPEDTLEAIRQHGVALKGPCTTPIGEGFSSVNVALRKKLNLYAAVRPVRSLPGVSTRYENVDLIVVRENTEGLYSGVENIVTEGTVISVKVATEEACERISRFAFRFATHQKRKKVSVFHKANIMKISDGLFLRESRKIYEHEYPNINYEEVIVDAGSMRLVQDPTQFDIVLCENLYGDIMSDLCAGLVGGLGVTPGANIGEKEAVFEAVHGSAPDIAGQNRANPLALLLSGVMMLRHLGDTRRDASCTQAADKIQAACDQALLDGAKTRDLGGELGTKQFADAVIERLS